MNNICYLYLTLVFAQFFYIYYQNKDLKTKIFYKATSNENSECEPSEKVLIGIGGGGSNIVEYLTLNSPNYYKPLIINSDHKALDRKNISNKIYLQGYKNYGCGSNEQCGLSLIDDNTLQSVKRHIGKEKAVYIVAALGGGVGSGSSKAIIKYLHEQDIKVNAIFVYPFTWEGIKRFNRAEDTYNFVKKYCNKIYKFNNDELKNFNHLSIKNCFNLCNDSIDKIIRGM